MKISVVFDLIARLAIKRGAAPLPKKYPGKCWETDIGAEWWIALNGNQCPVLCSRGIEVPAFTCYGEKNGWPALLVTPAGGEVGGPGWNPVDIEGELIALLKGEVGV